MKAAIVGIAGTTLAADEAALLRAHRPAGVILFARNVADPAQLVALTAHLARVLPPLAVTMVDQEGGRVARLRPPHWLAHPSAGRLGALHAADAPAGLRAAWLTGALIGLEAAAAGLEVVCAPVLDRAVPGADAVIGDRAYAADGAAVGEMAAAAAAGLLAAGVQPVGKHCPGHGRATADSHATPAPAGQRGRSRPGAVRPLRPSAMDDDRAHRLPGAGPGEPGHAVPRRHRRRHPRPARLRRRAGQRRPDHGGAVRQPGRARRRRAGRRVRPGAALLRRAGRDGGAAGRLPGRERGGARPDAPRAVPGADAPARRWTRPRCSPNGTALL